MKTLMILSNPFMVDPRVYKEAKSLIKAGHEVTVIVWDRKKDYEPESIVEGIKVVRVYNEGLMKILPNDLFRNKLWWKKAYTKGKHLYKNDFQFDVVHCHDLDTLQSGIWLKKKFGVKLVYDAHEIFGYMIARNMPKIVSNYALSMEKKLIKNVDQIITVNEPLEEYFKSITDNPIEIVMNCKELINKKYQTPKNDVFTLCYIGVLHRSRMFPEVIDIIGSIDNIKFVIAGKKENLYEEVKNRCNKYENIEFLGSIPFNEVIPTTLKSDLIVCMINPEDKNNKIGLANKQFEAMVCGRPIICSKGTFSGDLTEKLECGLSVVYNKESLKKAIIKLRDSPDLCRNFGRNGLENAIKKYNWEKQEEKLLRVYKKLSPSK